MAQPTNVVRLFFESVDRFPDHTALIENHRRISYKELAGEVLQSAAYFMREGIQEGDKVLVSVPPGIDLYRIVLALFYLGATPVFLDEWGSRMRLDNCLKIANCSAFIGTAKARWLGWLFSSELRKIPIKLGTRFPAIPAYPAMCQTQGRDTALLTFTPGNDHHPKAANRTHSLLIEQLRALKLEIRPIPEDIAMPALPIAMLMNLAVGTTSVIPHVNPKKPEKLTPSRLYEQLLTHHVTRFTAPTYVVRKVAEYMIYHNLKLPALQHVFTGGSPVFPEEALIYHTAFGEAEVRITYGSAEAEPISSITAEDLASRIESKLEEGLCVGTPFKGAEVRVIQIHDAPINIHSRQELDLLTCHTKEIGEILIRGPHVLDSYLNLEDSYRQEKIRIEDQIWHRTGDAGYISEDGQLFLAGRCQSVIQRDKRYFAPFLYENLFQQMDGVKSGTILEADKRILAIVELQEPKQRERIRSRLDHTGLPYDQLVFLHKIPKDPAHQTQIDYRALREMLG